MNNRGFYIESPAQMVSEAKRRGFVFVDSAVAQEYLLNHLYKPEDGLVFEHTNVPGVLLVKYVTTEELPF